MQISRDVFSTDITMAQLSKPCLPTFKSNWKSSDSVLSSLAIHRTDPRGFFSSLAVKKNSNSEKLAGHRSHLSIRQ